MFFELRMYRIRSGQRERWIKFADEVIIPYQVSKGMIVVGSFVGKDDEGLFVWMRRFASEEEKEQLYKAVYESEYWKNVISPQIPEMIDRDQIKVTRIEATPKSVIQ